MYCIDKDPNPRDGQAPHPTGLHAWPEVDPSPVMVNSPAEQPFIYEPQEGWKVGAWWYWTAKQEGSLNEELHWAGGLPAEIFLAEDSNGQKMGLSW